MKLYQKILYKLTLSFALISAIMSIGFAIDFYYDYNADTTAIGDETEIGKIIKNDAVEGENNISQSSALNQILDLFHLSQQDRYNSGTSKAIYYIKMIVNMMLSFVSLIALIMLIYAFYLMFFSKHESGMTKAKQVLKGIAIAISIMGLSWFIVSFIFWIQKGSAP